jgi:methyl-accepting chemotaxis protein
MTDDLTIQILREIRDGVRETNGRVDQTNAHLDQTNARLDQTNARLDQMNARMEDGFDVLTRRLVESEIRTATALTELAGSVRDVAVLLRSQHDLRPRVEKCEAEIAALKKQRGPRRV